MSIYWLASYPKSGNTWVRLFLNHYLLGTDDINSIAQTVISDVNPDFYQAASPIQLASLDAMSMEAFRYAALVHAIRFHPSTPKILKTHNANAMIHETRLIPPSMTAGSVYLVRDPRDVAVSLAEHMGTTIDKAIEVMATDGYALHESPETPHHWIGSWSTHVTSWVGQAGLVVRYEDLWARTSDLMAKILGEFGIEVDDPLLVEESVAAITFDNLRLQEEVSGFKEAKGGKFFSRGKPGGWKEVLVPEQVRRIERVHGEMMRKFGYL